MSLGRGASCAGEGDRRRPAATAARGRGRRGLGRLGAGRPRTGRRCGRSRWCRRRRPGCRRRGRGPELSSSTLPSSRRRRRRPPVLDEDLGEVAAGAQGGAQDPADHGVVDHGEPPRPRSASSWLDRPARVRPYRTQVPLEPRPARAERRAGRRRRRHRHRAALRRGAGARHPAARRAVRGGRRCAALDGQPRPGADHGRHAGAARPPGAHRGRPQVAAEATLEKVEGRRLTFTVSVNDERGLVAAGKVTRVVVEVERFLEKPAERPASRRARHASRSAVSRSPEVATTGVHVARGR